MRGMSTLPQINLWESGIGIHEAKPAVSIRFPAMNENHLLSRRKFLSASTKTTALGLLASGLPAGWVGAQTAGDAPETPNLNFGIIALTDCSPIVIAHEKGLFKKYGINATINKGANWAAIRDALSNGDNHATHMLIGMPIASTMGLLGSPTQKPSSLPTFMFATICVGGMVMREMSDPAPVASPGLIPPAASQ